MSDHHLSPVRGDRVCVLWGRWAGRIGTLRDWHYNPGGTRQQGQVYPVVMLDARGRATAREVRVLSVEKINPQPQVES